MLKAKTFFRALRKPLDLQVRTESKGCTYKDFMYLVNKMPTPEYSKLGNGLKVVTQKVEGTYACVGLFLDAGSRYESRFENGIAHFFEHIAFKSTMRRDAARLMHDIASTGAKFDCLTTREMVAYYAQCHISKIECVMDILFDCVFCNAFDKQEIEHQKNVVYYEMLQHDEDSNKVVMDYAHSMAFNGTSLANSVLGLSENLDNYTNETVCRYVETKFHPTRACLSVVSECNHDYIVKVANSYMCPDDKQVCTDTEYRYSGGDMRYRNDSLPFCNAIIAFEGAPFSHPDNIVLDMAATFLGGWDVSQPSGILNACPLARAGSVDHLCIGYEAFNTKYTDTALWGVHFMCKPYEIDDFLLHNIQHEFMRMCTIITKNEMERMKNEVISHALISCMSPLKECLSLGKWTLYRDCRYPLEMYVKAVQSVTVDEFKSTCDKYLYDRCPVVASIGASETLPDYNRIRSAQYWLRV